MQTEFDELKTTITDNVKSNRWYDEDGCYVCHWCHCPLIMHLNALGCGAKVDACKNPKCENNHGTR